MRLPFVHRFEKEFSYENPGVVNWEGEWSGAFTTLSPLLAYVTGKVFVYE